VWAPLRAAARFEDAIKNYSQYLHLCKSAKNAHGECLASRRRGHPERLLSLPWDPWDLSRDGIVESSRRRFQFHWDPSRNCDRSKFTKVIFALVFVRTLRTLGTTLSSPRDEH
jgi:hypothetical protein